MSIISQFEPLINANQPKNTFRAKPDSIFFKYDPLSGKFSEHELPEILYIIKDSLYPDQTANFNLSFSLAKEKMIG